MNSIEQYQHLCEEWRKARNATSMAQMSLDMMIDSFLCGFGSAPKLRDQDRVDNLRAIEVEKRLALDEFAYEFLSSNDVLDGNRVIAENSKAVENLNDRSLRL